MGSRTLGEQGIVGYWGARIGALWRTEGGGEQGIVGSWGSRALWDTAGWERALWNTGR